jgi:hypothetical protein
MNADHARIGPVFAHITIDEDDGNRIRGGRGLGEERMARPSRENRDCESEEWEGAHNGEVIEIIAITMP